MKLYIQDRVTNEVIAKNDDLQAVYDNELLFNRQRSLKAIVHELDDAILFSLQREPLHRLAYSADIAQAALILRSNMMFIIVDDNANSDTYDEQYFNYKQELTIFKSKYCNLTDGAS